MHYTELYSGDEERLKDGLTILERVVDRSLLDIWIYGITSDPAILDVAKEAIVADTEGSELTLDESDIELTEVALALPASSDSLNLLLGSGYPLRDLTFLYQGGEGEGIRDVTFSGSHTTSGTVTIDKLGKRALAESNTYLDEFLRKRGSGTMAQIPKKVQRSEEATVNAPHVPEPPALQTPQPVAKQTSLNISALVEDFLG